MKNRQAVFRRQKRDVMTQSKKSNTQSNAKLQADGMQIRKMPFEFPSDIGPHWNKENPEWSHMVNGASLAMPYLEPYLIRTMRKALDLIDSGQLKKEVKLYIGQEGQHFQQHRRFNDILIENGYSELVDLEKRLADDYKRYETTKSHRFNLSYAAGFESMALGIGHWLIMEREELFGGSDSRVASLILWHFVEEIEHKNVAIDAYNAVYGDYWYRIYGMIFATIHIVAYTQRAYKSMLKRDGLWSNLKSRWRLLKMIGKFYKNMIPPFLDACRPNHHPSEVKDPKWSDDWIKTYQKDNQQLAMLDTDNLHKSFGAI